MKNIVIILAGGLGKRMNSDLPKVCHYFNNIPMIVRVYNECVKTSPTKIFIIVGKYKDIIKNTLEKFNIIENLNFNFVIQNEPLGTGHAVNCCIKNLVNYPKYNTIILCGDIPLINGDLLKKINNKNYNALCVTTKYENPKSYGRIFRKNKLFEKIIEFKDCNDEESKINEVNCGIYIISSDFLIKYVPLINNNNSQHEYYLTDIIELIKTNENILIDTFEISKMINIWLKELILKKN